jgi:hypothetical protein
MQERIILNPEETGFGKNYCFTIRGSFSKKQIREEIEAIVKGKVRVTSSNRKGYKLYYVMVKPELEAKLIEYLLLLKEELSKENFDVKVLEDRIDKL